MLSKAKKLIHVASAKELLKESYYNRLWIAVRNVPICRRDWLDEIADALRDFDGLIRHRSGETYTVPLVDDVFGDDSDMRWMGYYLKPDESGELPLSKTRKIERLRVLDLYFKIRYPDMSEHIRR